MKSLKDAKITIRDFTEADIIAQDKYLGQASDEYLINMGVEPSAVRNMSSSSRVHPLLATPVKDRQIHIFSVDVDDRLVGISVLKKIQFGESAEVHVHIFNLENRHQGYATQIFWKMLKKMFVTFDFKILICEPCVSNLAPNAFLQKMGLKIISKVITPAGGILREHEANRYEITKEFYEKRAISEL